MKKHHILEWGLVLIACLSSCYSNLHLTEQPEFKEYSGQKGVWVMKAKTTQGEFVIYSREYPGILKDTAVITYHSRLDTILKSHVDSTRLNYHKTKLSHFWLNGERHAIIKDTDSTFSYFVQDTLSLPFKEIAEVDAIKFQKTQSFLFTFTTISAAVGLVLLGIFSSMSFSIFG